MHREEPQHHDESSAPTVDHNVDYQEHEGHDEEKTREDNIHHEETQHEETAVHVHLLWDYNWVL